ncbi:MAG: endonuclease [Bacteroidota bacterium]
MRSRFLLLFFLAHCSFFSSAQIITSQSTQLDFGQVNELSRDSLSLWIQNPSSGEIEVTDILFFNTFGKAAFDTPNKTFSIAPKDSQLVKVYFAPRHNILHNSEMLILSNSDRGSLSIDLKGQGVFSNTYYSSTQNKEGEALRSALKSRLAQGFQQLSYNQARDQMYMVIDNWRVNGRGANANKTEGAYSARVASPYSNRSQAQVNFQFDTEHIFPQGTFNQNLPMRSDLFHLATTWRTANSTRGNLNFGNVSGTPDWEVGGSKRGGGVFEPRDEQKGRNARAMFYFVVRYQNYTGHMKANEETVLRQWHATFAPDDIDRKRNEDIFSAQGNRNPFIDYPQLVERIASLVGDGDLPAQKEIHLSENLIDYDTVYAQESVVYNYVIINRGNTAINLSNFSLADSYLDFVDNSGADLSLAAGEAHNIRIRLRAPANSQLQSSLNFSSDVAGQEQISIPINAISEGANPIDPSLRSELRLKIFPNPANEQVWLDYQAGKSPHLDLQLFDAWGRSLEANIRLQKGQIESLDTQRLGAGIYFLQVSDGKRAFFERIQIR